MWKQLSWTTSTSIRMKSTNCIRKLLKARYDTKINDIRGCPLLPRPVLAVQEGKGKYTFRKASKETSSKSFFERCIFLSALPVNVLILQSNACMCIIYILNNFSTRGKARGGVEERIYNSCSMMEFYSYIPSRKWAYFYALSQIVVAPNQTVFRDNFIYGSSVPNSAIPL